MNNINEERKERLTLEEVLADVLEWSNATFPDADPHSISSHLLLEAHELHRSPGDPGEIADVIMLVAHLAQKQDIDLVKAVADKLEICRKRTWGKPNKDGVIEHLPHG